MSKNQSVIYTITDEETGEVSFSAYPADHPLYIKNHIVLGHIFNGDSQQPIVSQIERVFHQAGVQIIKQ